MIDILKEEVLTIVEQGRAQDVDVMWSDAEQKNLAILTSSSASKVVALFAVKSSSFAGYSFRSFNLNVSKWRWAMDEGFTPQQMYDDLGDMIFDEIPIDSIVHILS
jgi:hypothetical protein